MVVRGVRLVDVHTHGPLEVGEGAGYWVQTLGGRTSPDSGGSAEAQSQSRADGSGTLDAPRRAATIGPLQCSRSLTRWRRGGLGLGKARSLGILAYVEGGEPSSCGRDNGSLARPFWRALDASDYWLTRARLWAADAVCGPGAAGSG